MSKEENIVEFKFKLSNSKCIHDVIDHYRSVINRYMSEVHNKEVNVTLEFKKLDLPIGLSPYTDNISVECSYLDNNNFRTSVFSFLIYGQNNCCGATTVSKTVIHPYFKRKKLGTILQYIKEDISLCRNISFMTCTDVYAVRASPKELEDLHNLKPYLPNTLLLLSTGWKVSEIFYNENSKNVVALYTKRISKQNLNEDLVMKIKLKESKLVKIENITIGADPELFLRSKESGEYVPSFFIIQGDKYNPTMISEEGHNIQCDNVMVEYGIPPSKTADEFVKNNLFVQDYLKEKVAEPHNLDLVIFPAVNFDPNNLLDERAKHFGCDPDFDAWSQGKPNVVGRPTPVLRCAGGHIHIGYDNHNELTNRYIVKAMDLFLGVPLINMEPDNKRKEMYGKAGSYRNQPWGVEYRSTSNFIFSSPELMKWAFNQTLKAIEFVNDDSQRSSLDSFSSDIISSINKKDKSTAKYLLDRFKIEELKTELVKS